MKIFQKERVIRRASRVDANHSRVIAAMRQIGAVVTDLSRCGGGVPDTLVSFRGKWWCFEIKDGLKPPSARDLTDDQELWIAAQRAPVYVVKSEQEAIDWLTTCECR